MRAPDPAPTPEAARAMARAAYVFLYPLVANYGAAYEMAIDPPAGDSGFGRWCRLHSDTPMGGTPRQSRRQVACTWLDLRDKSMLLLPPAGGWGGCVMEWFDLWGFTPEVSWEALQPRTDTPLLVHVLPGGPTGHDTRAEVRSETTLVNVLCVRNLPSHESLSSDPVSPDPVVVPAADPRVGVPPPPLPAWYTWHDAVLTGPDFWECAAFALSLVRPHPDDVAILDLLREIGVVAGASRDPDVFGQAVSWAIDLGMYEAIAELLRGARRVRDGGRRSTRRESDRDYFGRAVHTLAGPHCGRTRRGLGSVLVEH